jgi:CRISPR-associated endonuclease/helicase Cas3
LLWDRFLAPTIKNKIDGCCGGRGRSLFALVCGVHDVGKASPAFQAKVPSLASAVQEAGLGWREVDARSRAWHHTLAGAVILRRVLEEADWSPDAVSWVWPLVAGHHGVVPGPGKLSPPQGERPRGVMSGKSSRTRWSVVSPRSWTSTCPGVCQRGLHGVLSSSRCVAP